ncbi:MAG: type IV toxin-antitoxin system AbiEi family antitoxin domain-containing protein [Bacteroidota bacterium]
MNRTEQILELAKEKGIIQAIDLEVLGITRNYLYKLSEKGQLIRTARGMYMLPDAPITENQNLVEIAKKIPNAVVCLISALSFHGITTQIPHEIWIAVPRDTWRPGIVYPPLHYTVLMENVYNFGIQEVNINGTIVKIYSPAKTVADCFKFRNKVGVDVAIEALREVWRSRKATMDELVEAAEVDRVSKIIRPYLEAIV